MTAKIACKRPQGRARALSGGRGAVLVLSTAPNRSTAERIARALVSERLAACVNVVPGLLSVYRWQGRIMRDAEALCLVKTRRQLLGQISERLSELHPYEVPELIALPVSGGARPYLKWLGEETRGRARRMAARPPAGSRSRSSGPRKGSSR